MKRRNFLFLSVTSQIERQEQKQLFEKERNRKKY